MGTTLSGSFIRNDRYGPAIQPTCDTDAMATAPSVSQQHSGSLKYFSSIKCSNIKGVTFQMQLYSKWYVAKTYCSLDSGQEKRIVRFQWRRGLKNKGGGGGPQLSLITQAWLLVVKKHTTLFKRKEVGFRFLTFHQHLICQIFLFVLN